MLGLIFGAGIFALPASVARAGVGWGAFHFFVTLAVMIVVHLWYAEVAYFSEDSGRFTGYVRKLIGPKSSRVSFLLILVTYHGALLAYGLLGGIFLHSLFPAFSQFFWSLAFFALAGALTIFRFEKISAIDFYLTIPLVLFVLYLSGGSLRAVDLSNFSTGSAPNWFLPYGVFIFSFGGMAAISETRDIMRNFGLRDLRNVILTSLLISAALYAIFIFSIVGVTGENTTDDALTGLASVLGGGAVLIGAIIGFLAVFTSYLAMAADMRNIFTMDYNIPILPAWLFTIIPSIIIYLLGATQFLEIVGFAGAFGLGVMTCFIFLMARKIHEKFPEHVHSWLSTKGFFAWFVLILTIAGAVLELLRLTRII
mgnify:CR=1 FL=1